MELLFWYIGFISLPILIIGIVIGQMQKNRAQDYQDRRARERYYSVWRVKDNETLKEQGD